MKLLLTLIISLTFLSVHAQEENALPYNSTEPKYDVGAYYPTKNYSPLEYLKDKIVLSESDKNSSFSGTVSVKFTVTKKGKVKNVIALNGIPGHPSLIKAVEKALLSMPVWVPAKKKGKPVSSEVFLNVPFVN
jgi:hypothetical protein